MKENWKRIMNRGLIGLLLVLVTCSSVGVDSVALSEESLNDLKRLPQFRRYLGRLSTKSHQAAREPLESLSPEGSGASYAGLSSSSSSSVAATWDMVAAMEGDQLGTSSLLTQVFGEEEEDGVRDSHHDDRSDKSGRITSVSDAKKMLKRRTMPEKVKKRKTKKTGSKKKLHDIDASSPATGRDKEAATEARKHLRRMTKANVECNQPSAKLMDVRQYHRDKSDLIFLPHCTWLHRCSDETGCCFDSAKTCSPVQTEIVSLYFYARRIASNETLIVKLDFDNHTRCGCSNRNSDLMPRTEEVILGPRNRYYGNWQIGSFYRSSSADAERDVSSLSQPEDASLLHRSGQRRHLPPVVNRHSLEHQCKCPSEYTKSEQEDESCVCDCSESRTGSNHCQRLKRGLETFFLRDRHCMAEGRCRLPRCEYGRYIATLGRCPKRGEPGASWLKRLT